MDNPELHLRPFKSDDIPAVRELFEQGRAFQRSLGFIQWLDGYPSNEILMQDIELSRGFVFELEGKIAGYASIFLDGDNEYERLSHVWHTPKEYGVIHRLVLGDWARGRHLAAKIIKLCEEIIATKGLLAVRVDTGIHNIPMHRLLTRAGYTNSGEHQFVWGTRFAFEKMISPR